MSLHYFDPVWYPQATGIGKEVNPDRGPIRPVQLPHVHRLAGLGQAKRANVWPVSPSENPRLASRFLQS